MLIDCDDCRVKGLACADCVVGVLLDSPVSGWEVDATEQSALRALADAGLVPRLRHESSPARGQADPPVAASG